jgi:signal transduction histidine kinase
VVVGPVRTLGTTMPVASGPGPPPSGQIDSSVRQRPGWSLRAYDPGMRGHIRAVDAVIAAAVLAASQVEISMTAEQVTGSLWAVRMSAAVVCAALLLMRAWPLGSVVVASAGLTCMALAGTAQIAIPFLVLLFLLGNLGWRATRRDGLVGVAVAAAGLVVAQFGAGDFTPGDLVVNWVIGGAAWLAPHLVRVSTDRRVAVEVSSERLAGAAVERERVRIARDLHDTVAHAVSVMTLQAGAARQNLDDHAATEAALLAIERSGRAAMEDLHGFLGDVRVDKDPLTVAVTSLGEFQAGAGTGSGLDGLRARVEAFGGTFAAAAEASDKWVVRAALPVGRPVR